MADPFLRENLQWTSMFAVSSRLSVQSFKATFPLASALLKAHCHKHITDYDYKYKHTATSLALMKDIAESILQIPQAYNMQTYLYNLN